jgi:predicted dehydrogenase
MANAIPIAVIGCGYWGAKHIRVGREISAIDVMLAVDTRVERLDYIQSEYRGITVSRDFNAALASDAAGVIIATPVSTHFSLARAALKAGKHVLVEKPLAMMSSECQELISIAEENKLVLEVGHTYEYHPAVAFTKKLIQRGDLGSIRYVDSRRLNLGLYQADTNVLWDLAPHDFSIIFHLLDDHPEEIKAWGSTHVLPGVEDVVFSMIKFREGTTAHVHVSWLDPVKVRQLTVVGSEGMLVFDDVLPSEKVRIYDRQFRPVNVGNSYADFQTAYHHGDIRIPLIGNGEPLKLEVLAFAKAISTGERPQADGYSGLRVVEALEAASRSLLEEGSWTSQAADRYSRSSNTLQDMIAH